MKQNLSESDLKNETANFSRFIVIESLQKVCLGKFSPFLEKVLSARAITRNVKKQEMETCLSRWTGRKHTKSEKFPQH